MTKSTIYLNDANNTSFSVSDLKGAKFITDGVMALCDNNDKLVAIVNISLLSHIICEPQANPE